MAYVTQSDVEDAAGGADALANLASTTDPGTADAAVVTSAIAKAQSMVDSYLGKERSVPMATPPEIVKRITAEEALYILMVQRRTDTERDIERHAENLAWLDKVSRGTVTVGVDDQGTASPLTRPLVLRNPGREDETDSEGFW